MCGADNVPDPTRPPHRHQHHDRQFAAGQTAGSAGHHRRSSNAAQMHETGAAVGRGPSCSCRQVRPAGPCLHTPPAGSRLLRLDPSPPCATHLSGKGRPAVVGGIPAALVGNVPSGVARRLYRRRRLPYGQFTMGHWRVLRRSLVVVPMAGNFRVGCLAIHDLVGIDASTHLITDLYIHGLCADFAA